MHYENADCLSKCEILCNDSIQREFVIQRKTPSKQAFTDRVMSRVDNKGSESIMQRLTTNDELMLVTSTKPTLTTYNF